MKESRRITLVVAEDLALVREGIAALCETAPQYKVVGQCQDGIAAAKLIGQLQPDIAVVDLNLPGLYGLEVVRRIRGQGLDTRLVVLSLRRDRRTVLEALRCGANAFVLKADHGAHLLESFQRVLAGGIYISPQLELSQVFVPRQRKQPKDPFDSLSPREYQVFSLLIEGLRAKEVAARLDLNPKTVDTYRSSLMRKLGIYDVAGLVKFAIHRNLTTV